MSKATIRDVAAAAGVSVSAVSYILNDSPKKKYSEATVKAVRRAAEKLQYVPNRIARGMRSQTAGAIGIVGLWESVGGALAPTLRALSKAATARGISLLICGGSEDNAYIKAFQSRAVDGFVVFVPSSSSFNERACIRALKEAGAPFVMVNGTVGGEGIPSILYNYYEASALATRHLISLGKQRIAYIDSYFEDAARELRDRREGYVDTMREAGLLPRTFDLEQLSLEDLEGIEAVVTARAETARALQRRLLDGGISLTAALDILAGSEEKEGGDCKIPLTSVTFPYAEAAALSVDMAAGSVPFATFSPVPILQKGKTVRD